MTENPYTRCLFCSLHCPVGIRKHSPVQIEPDYPQPPDEVRQGLCYRGHFVAALMDHPKRLTEGFSHRGSNGPHRRYDTILHEAAEQIQQAAEAESLGVLLSGNLPTDEIAAAAAFFRNRLPARQVSLFIPSTDRALLQGLLSSQAALARREDIAHAECLLAIGDVLGTHPNLARDILAFRERAPKGRLINIDTLRGRTMRFATEGVLIQHGAEGQVMAALALLAGTPKKSFEKGLPKPEDLLAGAGLDKAGILPALEELKENKNSLILLTIPPGRNCQSEQWARTVGLLAAATKSKVLPLFTYGGSAGGLAVSQALELSSPATWWEAARQGVFSTVLIAGADPVGILPKENVEPALKKIGCVIAASAMPSATTRRADIILPMSFWFEMEGKLIDYQGNSLTMRALAKPPGAAISLVSLVNVLAEKMEVDRVKPVQINWSEVFNKIGNARTSALPVPSPPLEESEEVFVLTSRTENLDLYEGPLSRQLDWVLSLEPIPAVWFNPGDASRMKLRERDEVRISRNGTSIMLSARTNHAVPRHTAAVSATLAETRDLWTWQCEETGPTSGPALVTVSPTTVE